MNEIDVRLRNCLKETLQLKEEEIQNLNEDMPLQDMGLHSITFIKAIVVIENEFDIEIGDENLDLKKFKTYGDIIKLIESEINKSESESI